MPEAALERRIAVNDVTNFMWRLGFFLLVLGSDVGLIVWDIYLESGGLRLSLPNLTWPNEIRAFLALVGIDPGYLAPPVIAACVLSVLFMASAYLVVHFCVAALGTCQPLCRAFAAARQQGQQINWAVFIDEAYPIFKSLVLALVLLIFMMVIFFLLTKPMAQLQLASKMWKSDFEITVEGDKIGGTVKREIPDIHALMEKHQSEFSCAFISGFPYALLCMHFAAGLLTEIFLLYVLTHLSNMEERHSKVIRGIGGRCMRLFRRRRNAAGHGDSASPTCKEAQDIRNVALESAHAVAEHTPGYSSHESTGNLCEQPAIGCSASQAPVPEDVSKPEDQPVRVIGGSESVTPGDAMSKPDIYAVIQNNDSYLVYTREFYEKLHKGN